MLLVQLQQSPDYLLMLKSVESHGDVKLDDLPLMFGNQEWPWSGHPDLLSAAG